MDWFLKNQRHIIALQQRILQNRQIRRKHILILQECYFLNLITLDL